jgi:hypothetical protein
MFLFHGIPAAAGLLVTALALGAVAAPTKIIDPCDDEVGVRFPAIEVQNLRGKTLRLPDDLAGDLDLLLIAYEREQQTDLDTWLAALADLEIQPPAFAYYELPTISRSRAWMRGVIDGGMKQGIPDRAQRGRTITLYVDRDWFRRQIGTADTDEVAAVLIDRAGHIRQRWFGIYTAQAGAQLRALLGMSPRP